MIVNSFRVLSIVVVRHRNQGAVRDQLPVRILILVRSRIEMNRDEQHIRAMISSSTAKHNPHREKEIIVENESVEADYLLVSTPSSRVRNLIQREHELASLCCPDRSCGVVDGAEKLTLPLMMI